MAYRFDAKKTTRALISWIQAWFAENGDGCPCVIGISGGKDSSIAAALCVAALGEDRVIGVLMPNCVQHDIDMAKLLVSHLGIRSFELNIASPYNAIRTAAQVALQNGGMEGRLSGQAELNLAPRLRMTALYAISQTFDGRVVNTCNLSEDYVGYSTKFGDMAGDFSPLSRLTVTEVKAIGHLLGLPTELVEKAPIDGLCGKTDEDNLGFTYAMLDRYIREGICEDEDIRKKIERRHKRNLFKLQPMPCFDPSLPVCK